MGPRLALVSVVATVAVLVTAGPREARADPVDDLVGRYRAVAGRRDDAAYAAQEAALTALADVETEAAQRALRRLLDDERSARPKGPAPDRRRLALLAGAFVRHGRPDDLDLVLRWIEGERDAALSAAVARIAAGVHDPATRAHLRGAAFQRSAPAQKAQLARALGALGDPEAVVPLLAALREVDFDVRAEALTALGALKDEHAFAPMVVFLAADDARIRAVAAHALGMLGSSRAFPHLERALGDATPAVVIAAADALGLLAAAPSVPALIDRLAAARGKDLRVEEALERALERITGKTGLGVDADAWRAWWAENRDRTGPDVARANAPTTVAGPRYYGFPVRTSHVVFVLDVSRSMGWNGRLETAQTELRQVLEHLPQTTRFNLVTYSDDAAIWSEGLVPATPENVRRAVRFVDRARPTSGTNIYDGLRWALRDEEVDTVFFLSDGSPTVGAVVDPDEILADVAAGNRWRHVRIHTVALLKGDPPPMFAGQEDPVAAAAFMKRLAAENDGTFREVR